jgi:hypothetical protein
MLHQAGNPFRSYASVLPPTGLASIEDRVTPGALASVWSPGATLIDLVGLTPSLTQKWSLLSVSVTANLLLCVSLGVPVFGKLGKVIMGLLLNSGSPTLGAAGSSYVTPMLALPRDGSLAVPIWDPAVDSLPPIVPSNLTATATLPISGSIAPPQPVPISEGQGLAVGIWLTPSLLGAYASGLAFLQVSAASYNVNYDDGL